MTPNQQQAIKRAAEKIVGKYDGPFECPWCSVHPHRDACTFECAEARGLQQKHSQQVQEVAAIITAELAAVPSERQQIREELLFDLAHCKAEVVYGKTHIEHGEILRILDSRLPRQAVKPVATSGDQVVDESRSIRDPNSQSEVKVEGLAAGETAPSEGDAERVTFDLMEPVEDRLYKWEITPHLNSDYDYYVADDDKKALAIILEVAEEHLWDAAEEGEKRIMKVKLNRITAGSKEEK